MRDIKTKDNIRIGDKVIVISNEDEPTMVGHVKDFIKFNPGHSSSIPLVIEEGTGKEFTCFGILKLYDAALKAKLDAMPQPQRWNSVAQNYIMKEK